MTKASTDRRPHHLSDDDKAWVLKRLKDRGMTRAALGRAIGMTRQGVYEMLSVGGWTYDWPAIVAALGGTPPSGITPLLDDRLRNIVRRWPELAEDDKRMIESLIERMRSKKP